MARKDIKFLVVVALFIFLFSGFVASADLPTVNNYVASSTNYHVYADAVSVAGLLSTSTGYGLQSTLPVFSSEYSSSGSYAIRSGYLNMSSSSISVSIPGDVSMSPAIYTSGGGIGTGSASWTVTTDSSGGYTLSIKASVAPALKSADDSFSDYQPYISGVPDFAFQEGDGIGFFGFTPEGSDINSLYKDNGISCNTGSGDTINRCWDGLSTTNKTISGRISANSPGGTVTTVRFRASAGTAVHKRAGSYTATIIATALAL